MLSFLIRHLAGGGILDSLAFFLAVHFITDTSPLYIPRPPPSTFSFLIILLPHNTSSSQYPPCHTSFFIVYFFLTIYLPYYASSSLYSFNTLLLQYYTSLLLNSPIQLHFSLYKLVFYIYIHPHHNSSLAHLSPSYNFPQSLEIKPDFSEARDDVLAEEAEEEPTWREGHNKLTGKSRT